MIKLNSIKNFIQNEPNINDSFDFYFDNKHLNLSNNNSNRSSNQNTKRSINKSIQSLNLYNIKKNEFKETFKRSSHSLFYTHKSRNINNNLDNSNHGQISGFGNNKNITKSKFKSEIINKSLNRPYLEKINNNKTKSQLSNSKYYKNNKNPKIQIITNYVKKEKNRVLIRTRPLYDSFDDDESGKEEDNQGHSIHPSNYYIFLLNLLLFL